MYQWGKAHTTGSIVATEYSKWKRRKAAISCDHFLPVIIVQHAASNSRLKGTSCMFTQNRANQQTSCSRLHSYVVHRSVLQYNPNVTVHFKRLNKEEISPHNQTLPVGTSDQSQSDPQTSHVCYKVTTTQRPKPTVTATWTSAQFLTTRSALCRKNQNGHEYHARPKAGRGGGVAVGKNCRVILHATTDPAAGSSHQLSGSRPCCLF